VMIDELTSQYGYNPKDIEIQLIGSKPGEKLYEELMSFEETQRTIELDLYFSVLPTFKCIYHDIDYTYPNVISKAVHNPYNSANEQSLSIDELRDFLITNKLMDEAPEKIEYSKERFWPNGS